MDDEAIEWVIFLQRDAAYSYEKAAQERDSAKLSSNWLASKIQEAAAHSARLAREAMGVVERDEAVWA